MHWDKKNDSLRFPKHPVHHAIYKLFVQFDAIVPARRFGKPGNGSHSLTEEAVRHRQNVRLVNNRKMFLVN